MYFFTGRCESARVGVVAGSATRVLAQMSWGIGFIILSKSNWPGLLSRYQILC